jgi:hypothetical protein
MTYFGGSTGALIMAALIAGRATDSVLLAEIYRRALEAGDGPKETEVTSLAGWVRFRVPGRKPLYVRTDERGDGP